MKNYHCDKCGLKLQKGNRAFIQKVWSQFDRSNCQYYYFCEKHFNEVSILIEKYLDEGEQIMKCDKCKQDKGNNLQEVKISYQENYPTPIGVFGELYANTYKLCNSCCAKICKFIKGGE